MTQERVALDALPGRITELVSGGAA
jgi:hypothetical protein